MDAFSGKERHWSWLAQTLLNHFRFSHEVNILTTNDDRGVMLVDNDSLKRESLKRTVIEIEVTVFLCAWSTELITSI